MNKEGENHVCNAFLYDAKTVVECGCPDDVNFCKKCGLPRTLATLRNLPRDDPCLPNCRNLCGFNLKPSIDKEERTFVQDIMNSGTKEEQRFKENRPTSPCKASCLNSKGQCKILQITTKKPEKYPQVYRNLCNTNSSTKCSSLQTTGNQTELTLPQNYTLCYQETCSNSMNQIKNSERHNEVSAQNESTSEENSTAPKSLLCPGTTCPNSCVGRCKMAGIQQVLEQKYNTLKRLREKSKKICRAEVKDTSQVLRHLPQQGSSPVAYFRTNVNLPSDITQGTIFNIRNAKESINLRQEYNRPKFIHMDRMGKRIDETIFGKSPDDLMPRSNVPQNERNQNHSFAINDNFQCKHSGKEVSRKTELPPRTCIYSEDYKDNFPTRPVIETCTPDWSAVKYGTKTTDSRISKYGSKEPININLQTDSTEEFHTRISHGKIISTRVKQEALGSVRNKSRENSERNSQQSNRPISSKNGCRVCRQRPSPSRSRLCRSTCRSYRVLRSRENPPTGLPPCGKADNQAISTQPKTIQNQKGVGLICNICKKPTSVRPKLSVCKIGLSLRNRESSRGETAPRIRTCGKIDSVLAELTKSLQPSNERVSTPPKNVQTQKSTICNVCKKPFPSRPKVTSVSKVCRALKSRDSTRDVPSKKTDNPLAEITKYSKKYPTTCIGFTGTMNTQKIADVKYCSIHSPYTCQKIKEVTSENAKVFPKTCDVCRKCHSEKCSALKCRKIQNRDSSSRHSRSRETRRSRETYMGVCKNKVDKKCGCQGKPGQINFRKYDITPVCQRSRASINKVTTEYQERNQKVQGEGDTSKRSRSHEAKICTDLCKNTADKKCGCEGKPAQARIINEVEDSIKIKPAEHLQVDPRSGTSLSKGINEHQDRNVKVQGEGDISKRSLESGLNQQPCSDLCKNKVDKKCGCHGKQSQVNCINETKDFDEKKHGIAPEENLQVQKVQGEGDTTKRSQSLEPEVSQQSCTDICKNKAVKKCGCQFEVKTRNETKDFEAKPETLQVESRPAPEAKDDNEYQNKSEDTRKRSRSLEPRISQQPCTDICKNKVDKKCGCHGKPAQVKSINEMKTETKYIPSTEKLHPQDSHDTSPAENRQVWQHFSPTVNRDINGYQKRKVEGEGDSSKRCRSLEPITCTSDKKCGCHGKSAQITSNYELSSNATTHITSTENSTGRQRFSTSESKDTNDKMQGYTFKDQQSGSDLCRNKEDNKCRCRSLSPLRIKDETNKLVEEPKLHSSPDVTRDSKDYQANTNEPAERDISKYIQSRQTRLETDSNNKVNKNCGCCRKPSQREYHEMKNCVATNNLITPEVNFQVYTQSGAIVSKAINEYKDCDEASSSKLLFPKSPTKMSLQTDIVSNQQQMIHESSINSNKYDYPTKPVNQIYTPDWTAVKYGSKDKGRITPKASKRKSVTWGSEFARQIGDDNYETPVLLSKKDDDPIFKFSKEDLEKLMESLDEYEEKIENNCIISTVNLESDGWESFQIPEKISASGSAESGRNNNPRNSRSPCRCRRARLGRQG